MKKKLAENTPVELNLNSPRGEWKGVNLFIGRAGGHCLGAKQRRPASLSDEGGYRLQGGIPGYADMSYEIRRGASCPISSGLCIKVDAA